MTDTPSDTTPRAHRFEEEFFLQWHITDRCNLRCTHCYRDDHVADLPLPDLLRVLDSFEAFLADLGRPGRVMLTGGEPMASPHVYELAAECRRRGLPVRVLSNGTLVDAEAARALATAGVRTLQVSIDGTRDVHDAIRGAGAYDAAVAGMRAARAAGLDVTLSFTLTSANKHTLPGVARLARRHADRLHVSRHVPIGRGATLDARPLTAAEVRDVLVWMDRKRAAWRRAGLRVPLRDPLWVALLAGPDEVADDCGGGVFGCSVGYNGICVDADATAYPCRRLPLPLGNVLETPLSELWQHPALEKLRDRDALEGRCGRCDIRWICGGCRAVAEAIGGHPLDEDPHCFRLAPGG